MDLSKRNWMWLTAGAASLACAGMALAGPVVSNTWNTTVAAGANVTRGNSHTMVLNGSALTEGRIGENELRFGVEGNFGESEVVNPDGTKEDKSNMDNERAFAQYRRLLTERFFASANGEALRDEISDIDYRYIVGPGLGAYLLKDSRNTLEAGAGVSYIAQKQGEQEDDYWALRLAERYDVIISSTAKLWESVEYLPAFKSFKQYLLNSEVGAEAAMTSLINLRIVLQDKYNNEPAAGRKANDVMLVAGLSSKF